MGKLMNILKKIRFILDRKIQISLLAEVDRNTTLEGKNRIIGKADVRGSFLGFGTYVGDGSKIIKAKVGRFCSIAPDVKVRIGRHPTRDFVSTHPAFFSRRDTMSFSFVKEDKFEEFRTLEGGYSVLIGNDVWIGSDVILLEGITVGDGAIIGAGSVVSKDVEAYSVCVGNPMKVVRKRFTEEQIHKLLSLKWWNKDSEWIEKNVDKFESIDKLLK